jgi:hypothetical protein
MYPHLHVQLTVLSAGLGKGAVLPTEFATVLASSGHHFPATIRAKHPIQPGGSAVHCEVTFATPDAALPHFPAGSQFELREGGRKGYGTVLRVA